MKDFFGHHLEVGDLVTLTKGNHNGHDIHFGRVMGFTPKMVKVDYLGYSLSTMNKVSGSLMKVLAITPQVQVFVDSLNEKCIERMKKEMAS